MAYYAIYLCHPDRTDKIVTKHAESPSKRLVERLMRRLGLADLAYHVQRVDGPPAPGGVYIGPADEAADRLVQAGLHRCGCMPLTLADDGESKVYAIFPVNAERLWRAECDGPARPPKPAAAESMADFERPILLE